ncbi:hypothetical protein SBA4_310015 [Candidatus Sulfopaludibacter sp. SbA4]|nr:hypothetical protein SBA4_310015 [Candidatus Sulfopaludibacter sp. SbA4]
MGGAGTLLLGLRHREERRQMPVLPGAPAPPGIFFDGWNPGRGARFWRTGAANSGTEYQAR